MTTHEDSNRITDHPAARLDQLRLPSRLLPDDRRWQALSDGPFMMAALADFER